MDTLNEVYDRLKNTLTETRKITAKSIVVRNSIQGKGTGKSSVQSANTVESISSMCWFDIGSWYGGKYGVDVSVLKGNRRKILCRRSEDAFILSHVDVHIYINDEFIHGEECKTHIDCSYLERTYEVARRMRQDSDFCPTISVIALQPDIKEETSNFFFHDDILHGVNYLCDGKRSSGRVIWEFPFTDYHMDRYLKYISGVYESNLSGTLA